MSVVDFSVIIACYNPDLEKLKKTINSILNQVEISYEIIIADDGSKLDYETEIDNWLKSNGIKNYKLSFLKENQGTVINILSAAKISQGTYLKTIAPGDYLYDEFALKNYLKTFNKKNADIVFGRAQYFTEDLRFLKTLAPKMSMVYHNLFIKRTVVLYGDCILGATVAAKKEILMQYLTQVAGAVKYLEDFALISLAVLDGKRIIACNNNLVWYEYGTGISTNKKRTFLLEGDFEQVYHKIGLSKDRFSIKVVKFWRANKIKNPIKRFFIKLLISPTYLIFKFFRVFSFNLKPNGTIEELNKITTLTRVNNNEN